MREVLTEAMAHFAFVVWCLLTNRVCYLLLMTLAKLGDCLKAGEKSPGDLFQVMIFKYKLYLVG